MLRSDNTAKPNGIERRTVDDRHPGWCPSGNEHELRRAETESCGRDLPTNAASCEVRSGPGAAGRGCPLHPPPPRLGYSAPQTKHSVRVAASDPLQLSSLDAASGSLNPAAVGWDTSLPAVQRAGSAIWEQAGEGGAYNLSEGEAGPGSRGSGIEGGPRSLRAGPGLEDRGERAGPEA